MRNHQSRSKLVLEESFEEATNKSTKVVDKVVLLLK